MITPKQVYEKSLYILENAKVADRNEFFGPIFIENPVPDIPIIFSGLCALVRAVAHRLLLEQGLTEIESKNQASTYELRFEQESKMFVSPEKRGKTYWFTTINENSIKAREERISHLEMLIEYNSVKPQIYRTHQPIQQDLIIDEEYIADVKQRCFELAVSKAYKDGNKDIIFQGCELVTETTPNTKSHHITCIILAS